MATEFRWRHLAAESAYLLNKTRYRDVGVSMKHLMKFRDQWVFFNRVKNSIRDYFH